MINLLPVPAKKSILLEYWIRVVSVWMIVWAVALFAATSIFLPVYVLIGSQVKSYADSAAVASQKVASYESVSVALVQASQQAKLIIDEMNRPQFSSYIHKFEQLQGEGIQFSNIKLGRDDAGITPVTIGGVASDRQALASFRDRLLADEEVSAVNLPISNLARDKDIAFSISVTLHNKKEL
jgi:hypothetical protein